MATKEGALIARRGAELSATTDVGARPEFTGRKTTKTIAGQPVDGWFAEDFTLAEIAALFAREPDPTAHPQNARLDGKEPVLTLPDVLQIARDGCVRTGRTIGVCARLARPGALRRPRARRRRPPRRRAEHRGLCRGGRGDLGAGVRA